ncbi:TetR/AcrR family transcriptional regulator [Rhodococcus ruber]|uniref:TetR/AcrR family transcriptional regulator n=1 Tax=Rhodococcus ruber TaxID=1830 RepID=A0ABT4MHN0_9NOCA|nr:TetR/AcrR family transcriptional regulator [Rhodococcus ruber]MCZ4520497.1 TetR/AcrR family transcriptional regulator [Rhodococcus ruber]
MARVPVGQRRQELVEAAFRVIAASGIQKTTTRAICTEAGVNQGIFHYCFNSKKELFQELIRSVVTGMVETSAEIRPARSDTATAVRTVFDTAWQHARAHPDRHLVGYELTTMALRDDELADLAAWQYQQYFEQSMRAMASVEESAQIRWSIPMPVLGRMVATILDGLVLGWLADRDDDATERMLAQFADVVAGFAVER